MADYGLKVHEYYNGENCAYFEKLMQKLQTKHCMTSLWKSVAVAL